jgi:hypothetical protein
MAPEAIQKTSRRPRPFFNFCCIVFDMFLSRTYYHRE